MLGLGHVHAVVLLQELSHRLPAPADGVGLPLGVDARGVRLVDVRRAVVVEPRDQGRDAEGPTARRLRIPLFLF